MSGKLVGHVTHYYTRLGVAVLDLTDSIRLGDVLHILGSTTDLRQVVRSMQIEHEPVEEVSPGQEVALEVDRRVRPRDRVFRIDEE
jgi:translation initiation factor IF-2